MTKKKQDKCESTFPDDFNSQNECKDERKRAVKDLNLFLFAKRSINTLNKTTEMLHDNSRLKNMKKQLSSKQLGLLGTDIDKLIRLNELEKELPKEKKKNGDGK